MKLKEAIDSFSAWRAKRREESDKRTVDRIASRPKLTDIPDAELMRMMIEGVLEYPAGKPTAAKEPAPAHTEPVIIPNGIDKLKGVVESDDSLKSYVNISHLIFLLLKMDLRGSTNEESILTYLGFQKDFVLKFFQAFFGQFGVDELSTEDGTRNLMKANRSFNKTLYYDAMHLTDQSSEQSVRDECNVLLATAARLRSIWHIQDIEKISKIMKSVTEKERERKGRGDKLTKLTFPEMRVIAEDPRIAGYDKPLPVRDFSVDLQEIEKIISENAEKSREGHLKAMASKLRIDLGVLLLKGSPELMFAIERLKRLYIRFRTLDEDEKFQLASKINETSIAEGNLIGIQFYNAIQPDILNIIITKFNLVSNKDLEAKIMEIDSEFRLKNIY